MHVVALPLFCEPLSNESCPASVVKNICVPVATRDALLALSSLGARGGDGAVLSLFEDTVRRQQERDAAYACPQHKSLIPPPAVD